MKIGTLSQFLAQGALYICGIILNKRLCREDPIMITLTTSWMRNK